MTSRPPTCLGPHTPPPSLPFAVPPRLCLGFGSEVPSPFSRDNGNGAPGPTRSSTPSAPRKSHGVQPLGSPAHPGAVSPCTPTPTAAKGAPVLPGAGFQRRHQAAFPGKIWVGGTPPRLACAHACGSGAVRVLLPQGARSAPASGLRGAAGAPRLGARLRGASCGGRPKGRAQTASEGHRVGFPGGGRGAPGSLRGCPSREVGTAGADTGFPEKVTQARPCGSR